MKFKLILLVSCLCVHFATSADEPTTDVEKIESRDLIKLMNDAADAGQHKKANEEFREKYGQHQIELTELWDKEELLIVSNGMITVDFETAPQFLDAFAESIKSLVVDYRSLTAERQSEVGRLINTRCADTLEVLHMRMGSAAGGNFEGMELPFKVERLAIDGHMRKKPSGLATNELFPEMRVLNLSGYFNDDILNQHYWKLMELNIFRLDQGPNTNNLRKLFKRNPQIKNLRFEDTVPFAFLQLANKYLPKLAAIAFNVPSDLANHPELLVEFEQVNELTVTDSDNLMQNGKISFKNLKRFDLLVNGNIRDEWINFIGSNKDLESLTITNGVFNDATLLSLPKKLMEADINCDKSVSVDSIVSFMEDNKKLKKITLNLEQDSSANYKDLVKRLEQKWKITPINNSFSTLLAIKLEPYGEGIKNEGNRQPVIKPGNPQGDQNPQGAQNPQGDEKPSTNNDNVPPVGVGSPEEGVPPLISLPQDQPNDPVDELPQGQPNDPVDDQNPGSSTAPTTQPPPNKPDSAVVCFVSAKLLILSVLSVATIALFI